jgi:WxcM-like protein
MQYGWARAETASPLDGAAEVDLPGNPTGLRQITFVEADRHIPFPIARAYWIHGLKAGEIRGRHAHRAMNQFLVAVNGSFEVSLDDGTSTRTFLLDDATRGLVVPAGLWRVITTLEAGSVLLSLSSTKYLESDYIRDYEAFKEFARRAETEKLDAS